MMHPWGDEEDEPITFPGLMMADSQISALDISQGMGGKDDNDTTHIYEDGLVTSKPSSTKITAKPCRRPRATESPMQQQQQQQQRQHTNTGYSSGLTFNNSFHTALRNTNINPSPSPQPPKTSNYNRKSPPSEDPPSLSSSWSSTTTTLASAPRHPNENQQDLAVRINALSAAISTGTGTCLEVSARMLALARDNRHHAYAAGNTLDAYVLRPALAALGGGITTALRTYCPGVLGVVGVGGGDGGKEGGGGGVLRVRVSGEGTAERQRLKDRLVEQDALLSDSNQHLRRLISERNALRKQLEAVETAREKGEKGGKDTATSKKKGEGRISEKKKDTATLPSSAEEVPSTEARRLSSAATTIARPRPQDNNDEGEENGNEDADARNREKQLTEQLTEQLRELRVLVDQMALYDSSSHNRLSMPFVHREAQPTTEMEDLQDYIIL
ncbi:Uu.00g126700.m01.CDS01 [Anthostomella pinea]|uniref:Uu.00g126700.m01.CDS01 n=1 Tax=Anthostomella pinea TaxID=933095 RepID=A0AAI8VIP7_9PEZI|nr:Uu.00g126700.m01.CDS01 [Anthostomella pinea]